VEQVQAIAVNADAVLVRRIKGVAGDMIALVDDGDRLACFSQISGYGGP
jgi:hypothetical protein